MQKVIYLAGGCFWGLQHYLKNINGVLKTTVGYANGNKKVITYEQVCNGNSVFAETVEVIYDDLKLSLTFLLKMYFKAIDPCSVNQQGNDVGDQYRTGIYYQHAEDLAIIREAIEWLQTQMPQPIMIEVAALQNFIVAEQYHQDYLIKNPQGYCHLHPQIMNAALKASAPTRDFPIKSKEVLKKSLSDLEFAVTQRSATEAPFTNAYDQTFKPGIYVDKTTGQPLFYSVDKFDSGCGWPAFSKPISQHVVYTRNDHSNNMLRQEVRASHSDAHLGHVFNDEPQQNGGLRYCINSAALTFIPFEQMEAKGYAKYLNLFKK